jgi:hypothetical protein
MTASLFALTLLVVAQTPGPDATVAALDLRRGETVIVVTDTETIRGRVLRLAADGLVLTDGGAQHTVALQRLNRVERPPDSLWNGAFAGYAVGFGVGFALVIANPCDPYAFLCWDGPGFGALVGGIITGPLGMLGGAITDALIKRPRIVFDKRSSSRTRTAIAPVLLRGGAGLRVVVAF